jgi:hypothetical protein
MSDRKASKNDGSFGPAGKHDFRVKQEQRDGHVAGRRGITQVAANGGGVAQLRTRETVGCLQENRYGFRYVFVLENFTDSCACTDSYQTVNRNVTHAVNAANVKERSFESPFPGLGLWHQVRAAREHRDIAVMHDPGSLFNGGRC